MVAKLDTLEICAIYVSFLFLFSFEQCFIEFFKCFKHINNYSILQLVRTVIMARTVLVYAPITAGHVKPLTVHAFVIQVGCSPTVV